MNSDRWMFVVLLGLPLVAALVGLGLFGTFLLVLLWLIARWLLTLRGLTLRHKPEPQLDTIGASHFAEKVRWCLDSAGIAYKEHQNVGTLGAFFVGRTVPRLRVATGSVETSIGNSSDILRYLHGRYGHEHPEQRAFLIPSPERIAWEKRLDRYGVHLQIWVYYHMLKKPETLSKVWGISDPGLPAIQRAVATLIAPVLRILIRRAFSVSEHSVVQARQKIETLLEEAEVRLVDSPFLVGNERSYVDYTLAALSALWLLPEQFGGGKTNGVRLEQGDYPVGLIADANTWRERFPATVSFMENLYQNERARSQPPLESSEDAVLTPGSHT